MLLCLTYGTKSGFELGYKGKSVIDIDKVFDALDSNKSGYIEYTGKRASL